MMARTFNDKQYPSIDMVKTGENIRRIMKRKGFTVRYVQEYLELNTPQSLYHWFYGRNLPSVDNLYALSELFSMPVDELLIGNRSFKPTCHSSKYLRSLAYHDGIIDLLAG